MLIVNSLQICKYRGCVGQMLVSAANVSSGEITCPICDRKHVVLVSESSSEYNFMKISVTALDNKEAVKRPFDRKHVYTILGSGRIVASVSSVLCAKFYSRDAAIQALIQLAREDYDVWFQHKGGSNWLVHVSIKDREEI